LVYNGIPGCSVIEDQALNFNVESVSMHVQLDISNTVAILARSVYSCRKGYMFCLC